MSEELKRIRERVEGSRDWTGDFYGLQYNRDVPFLLAEIESRDAQIAALAADAIDRIGSASERRGD